MKYKIVIAAALLATASFSIAEIVVNDFFFFIGFVDSPYSPADFDTVTSQIDLEYEEAVAGAEVEQAFVNYVFGNDDIITGSRLRGL